MAGTRKEEAPKRYEGMKVLCIEPDHFVQYCLQRLSVAFQNFKYGVFPAWLEMPGIEPGAFCMQNIWFAYVITLAQ